MRKPIEILKKSLAIMLSLALTFSLSACGNNESGTKSKSLYEQGLEVIKLMSEMIQSEEYIDVYTTNSEVKSVIQTISAGDYTTPKKVYTITVTDESLPLISEISSINDASEDLKNFIRQRIFSSLMTQINGMSGVENLAAASVCTAGKTFVNKNVNEDVIYLYTFENAVPVAVTFTVGEDNAISASGIFVMYDDFNGESIDEIRSLFEYMAVEVTEVTEEQ